MWIGGGNSNIDKASSGGVYVQVDIKEGVVVSCALNYVFIGEFNSIFLKSSLSVICLCFDRHFNTLL